MKEQMWEDRFTPEGVPMTAPTDAGMAGPQNGQYEHQKWKDGRPRKSKEPTMTFR
jgi:hypothetical protein